MSKTDLPNKCIEEYMTKTQKNIIHVMMRDVMGKKVSKIRREGLVPGNIYGEEQESIMITLGKSDLVRFLKAEGDSGLIYLVLGEEKKETPALIEEIQYDTVLGDPLHISFKRVNLKEKVTQEVPVEMTGEVDIPGATVFLTRDVVEVEALPADLPESILLDISSLKEVGESLFLKDAQYDRDTVEVLLSEEELESPLVIVQAHVEEVEETPEDASEEGAEGESETPEAEAETEASEE